MKKILILWLGLFILLASCNPQGDSDDDDPNPDGNPSREELLVQSWNITTVIIDGQSQSPSSQADVGFNENGTYNIILPELDFFPTMGTWELINNDTQVSINGGEYVLNVIELTEERMILELEYDNFKAEPTTYQLSFQNSN
ncbi:MAG: lipocalin family protein [Bacteroidota bacterium]